MPTEVYTKVIGDDGAEKYELVSELPDDVIKETKLYQDVLKESISRRQKLTELKGQLEEKPEPTPQPTATPTQPDPLGFASREDLMKYIQTTLATETEQKTASQRAKEEAMLNLINTHKLSSEALPLLLKSAEPEALAAFLGKEKLKFDDYKGSQPNPTPSAESIREKVATKLNLVTKE